MTSIAMVRESAEIHSDSQDMTKKPSSEKLADMLTKKRKPPQQVKSQMDDKAIEELRRRATIDTTMLHMSK